MLGPTTSRSAIFDARWFDPSNLKAWYSAQLFNGDGVALPSVNSTVTTWVDLSANSRNQAISGTATFRANIFGTDLYGVEYNAGAKSKSPTFAHPQSWTAYAIIQSITTTGIRGIMDADDGGSRQAQYLRFSSSNNIESIAFNGASPHIAGNTTNPLAKQLAVARASETDHTLSVWVDNTLKQQVVTSSPLNAYSQWLGINSASNVDSGNMYYGEIILYGSAHDTTTRQSIQTSLAATYNIALT